MLCCLDVSEQISPTTLANEVDSGSDFPLLAIIEFVSLDPIEMS